MKKTLSYILKILSFLGVFILGIIITLYATLLIICYGPSKKARNLFATTFLETGALKFVVGLVMPDSLVQEIVNQNSMQELEGDVDDSLINVSADNTIEVKEINGSNFYATMLIVHDPSKVSVATTYPFSEYGKTLDKMVSANENLIGGINGGIYVSTGNKGGYPMGVVVSNGQIQWNSPNGRGYYLIALDESNILRIISLEGKSKADVEKMVKEDHIRDAVTFQEEATDANNHFVKLIINGEKRVLNGLGSGANPRTAIGQREDGALLLLVTDGRGKSGHLGATAADLIDIMEEYGAINAANLDGGSSSCMYYNNEYLMTSVTMYYSNSSWNLPEAFVISK